MKTSEGGGSDPPSASGTGGAAAEGDPVALVMKRFPFLLQLRERYTAVSGEESFARLPRFATTEAEHAMRREDVLNLALQWLAQRGFARSVSSLEEATG